MTTLIKLSAIADEAARRGFRVERYMNSVHVHDPDRSGPDAVWHNGANYSTAEFIITDSCDIGYGYNSCFFGPFHPGYCRPNCFGLNKLLKHPMMAGASF